MSIPTNPAEPDSKWPTEIACPTCGQTHEGPAARELRAKLAQQAKPAPDDRQRYASGYED